MLINKGIEQHQAEIIRLNKIIDVLTDRAEHCSVDVRLPEQFLLIDKLNQSNKIKYPINKLCDVFEVHRSSYKY
ncbi:MAG: hypothetical protein HRT51_15490 [Colwellia sp.]|nr:hypothetical protein [Colwellia sp.]